MYIELTEKIFTLLVDVSDNIVYPKDLEKENYIQVELNGYVGDLDAFYDENAVKIDIDNQTGKIQYLINKEVWNEGIKKTKQDFVDSCKKDIDRMYESMKNPDNIEIEMFHQSSDDSIIDELKEYYTSVVNDAIEKVSEAAKAK